MDLDEEVEPVAQEPIVLNRAIGGGEQSEELFLLLLLGGRWKQQNFRLHVIERFWPACRERERGGRGLALPSYAVLVLLARPRRSSSVLLP